LAGALRRRFGRSPHVEILEVDVEGASDVPAGVPVGVSFNGLASAGDPERWLAGASTLLEPEGRLFLLVPAHEDLASPVDASITNRRRFAADELDTLLSRAGFSVERIEEFNRLGAIAWRLSGAFGLTRVGGWQARIFSLLVPLARMLDDVLPNRGLSLVVSARKRR
jgi:hypothetical protein